MSKTMINSKSAAHITAQVRAKQLAIKGSQDKIKQEIILYLKNHPDVSEIALAKKSHEIIVEYYKASNKINGYLKDQKLDDIGYPIKNNKTAAQLEMAKSWAEDVEDDLISQVTKGRFYHSLDNNTSEGLPILQSLSKEVYWGNENPSITSVMLASIASVCDMKDISIPGAAEFYPFRNRAYKLPDDLVPESYSFANKRGMKIFGSYQFGGQRSLDQQLVFAPEDCSSALGKATNLTTEQIQSLTTSGIINIYGKPNTYNYKAVTHLHDEIKQEQLELIEPGDIWLIKGHTAIILTKPDNKSNITTAQFSRNIEISTEHKVEGGGLFDYNLTQELKERGDIYILRSSQQPWHESYTLSEHINVIDSNYSELFPNGPTEMVGNCSIFFDRS